MIYLCRLNPFIKFNIYNIVLKPWRIIFQHFSTAYIYTLIGGFSEMKSLSANFSWLRFSKLLRRFFLLIRVFCFCFLYLNFAIIVSFFQTMASFKVISNSFKTFFYFLILNFAIIVSFFSDDGKYLLQRERKRERGRERALKTLSSSYLLLIDAGTGLISIGSRRWYWALLTAFYLDDSFTQKRIAISSNRYLKG